jgi:very-short-patch-repair endonuclease
MKKIERREFAALLRDQHGVATRSQLRHLGVTAQMVHTRVERAGVVASAALDEAVDRALASKLVTVEALVAELQRLSRPGRTGTGRFRAALARRGFIGAPNPSVLESRVLRLLRQAGITPINVEVRMGPHGRYRVDILLVPGVVMEVDGFAYHHSPEQVTEDERRRRRLRIQGVQILVYTWLDVTRDWWRTAHEIGQVLAREERQVG